MGRQRPAAVLLERSGVRQAAHRHDLELTLGADRAVHRDVALALGRFLIVHDLSDPAARRVARALAFLAAEQGEIISPPG
jgi:hypothetical protein